MEFITQNWYLFLALVVVIALLVYEPLRRRLYGVRAITPLEVPQLMSHESAVVIDVGEPKEYAAGHIAGAINVPLGRLREELPKLEKYKARPVIVCCRSGHRSPRAAMVLRRQGFGTVHSLAGGVLAWQKENLPVEKS